jgi:hypothetical protein
LVSIKALEGVDFSSWDEPDPSLRQREFLEQWLQYQRHEFVRKLRDLSPAQLVKWSVPPVALSILGLVRHMTQMEHVYVSWGVGGGERVLRYGDSDYAGGSVDTVEDDLRWYFAEVAVSDAAIDEMGSLDDPGAGHGRPLRAVLVKMVDEYALHAGQAHMIRFAALGDVIR